MQLKWARDGIAVASLAAAYFLAAKAGLTVAVASQQVSAVWPPSGIALAVVCLLGIRVWPGIAIGAFLANVTSHEPVATALAIACGNTLEALVALWLLKRVVQFNPRLERFQDAFGLVVLAAGVSTMISSTIGTASLCLGGVEPFTKFGKLWEIWWLGDAMGDLVLAPAILVWVTSWRQVWTWRKIAEGFVLALLLCAVSWRVFATHVLEEDIQYKFAFFPLLAWTAVRFGQRGSTMATLVISLVALAETLAGNGPFDLPSINDSLNRLQTFMAIMATTGLLLAAAISERTLVQKLLKESDQRKDEFLATLAHELRNPLAPISNAMQFLKLAGPRYPELHGVTDIIERQVRQMTRLIDDLLDISRITRNRLELKKEPIDLESIVRSAVETSAPIIEAHRHALSVRLPQEPLLLVADPIRLAQVFSNLLNNAAKFTSPGGRIDLFGEIRGAEVIVTVRDTGAGIRESELSRVFEMFNQGAAANSGSLNGLGIGLALAKRLVHLHGGSIEAQSDGPGRGSEFRVRLPVPADATRGPVAAASARDKLVSSDHLRILVVDDNADSVESLRMLLSAVGCDVRAAHDGFEGVRMAAAFRPAIVLLDIGMPVMDGYQAARHIRDHDWGSDMTLIALTGWGQDEDRRRSAEAGFDHHLTKPVDMSELKRLLANSKARVRSSG